LLPSPLILPFSNWLAKVADVVKRQVAPILMCSFILQVVFAEVLKVNAQYCVRVLVSSVKLFSDFGLKFGIVGLL
jgi:hypothetical protein